MARAQNNQNSAQRLQSNQVRQNALDYLASFKKSEHLNYAGKPQSRSGSTQAPAAMMNPSLIMPPNTIQHHTNKQSLIQNRAMMLPPRPPLEHSTSVMNMPLKPQNPYDLNDFQPLLDQQNP